MKNWSGIVAVATLVVLTAAVLFTIGCGGDQMSYLQGQAGKDGIDGQNGLNGEKGDKGDKGDIGETGAAGPVGPQGIDGTNGTVISLVQFCTSSVAAYPSVFPEIAMCIGGKLYGVYSANGGFLTYLPNGNYYSNGINSSCTFHITGCVVTP